MKEYAKTVLGVELSASLYTESDMMEEYVKVIIFISMYLYFEKVICEAMYYEIYYTMCLNITLSA